MNINTKLLQLSTVQMFSVATTSIAGVFQTY